MSARLFISYRRSRQAEVAAAKSILVAAGVEVWLDVQDIDPLDDFPQRIRDGIDGSHAMLVWWSADYTESDICLQELRLAWQHARRQSSDVARRVWILNPESRGDHVFAGELNASNFLTPPSPDEAENWAGGLKKRLDALLPEGPLGDERRALPVPARHGVPTVSDRFTGRGAELMRIHSALFPPKVGASAAGVAVQTHGMGGIGKTELATKYVQDFAHAFPAGVFWLNLASWTPVTPASEADAQAAWLRALERTLERHPRLWQSIALDVEGRILPALGVRERLSQHLTGDDPALFVLDNLPQLSPLDVRQRILAFLGAPGAHGKTLITTRDARGIDGFRPLALEVLSADDALRLLVRHMAEAQRARRQDGERDAIEAVITEVGGHTLALVLLGERYGDVPAGYIHAIDDLRTQGQLARIEAIADDLREDIGERARGIVATFAISIDPLPGAAKDLLALASACAPNTPIPDAMLALAFGGESADEFARALRVLSRASLLTRRKHDAALEIHSLVAQASLALLNPDLAALRARTADALLEHLSILERNKSKAREMLAHAAHAAHLAPHLPDQNGVGLYLLLGLYETGRGQLHLARAASASALELATEVLGHEHPDTLDSMNNLAEAIRAQGDLVKARKIHKQALEIRRRVLGEEHPDTLISKNNFASTLWAQGEFAEARSLQEQVLEVRQRTLGKEHLDTVNSMNNLAETLRAQGDLIEARELQEQALEVRQRVLGEEHPNTIISMGNLASICRALGELGGARELQERALGLHQRVLGEAHPDTLTSMNNLAETVRAQGELVEARKLHRQTLKIRQRVLGVEHPDTLISMGNLALILWAQGELTESRDLEEQVLAIRQRVLGENHPATSISAWSLFLTLTDMGDADAAQAVLKKHLAWLVHHPPHQFSANQRTIQGYVREQLGLDADTPPDT